MALRIAHSVTPVMADASFKENDSAFGLGEIDGTATADAAFFFDAECLLTTHLQVCPDFNAPGCGQGNVYAAFPARRCATGTAAAAGESASACCSSACAIKCWIACGDMSQRCPIRTNLSLPARHSCRTANGVVDINVAVVEMSCRSGDTAADKGGSVGEGNLRGSTDTPLLEGACFDFFTVEKLQL